MVDRKDQGSSNDRDPRSKRFGIFENMPTIETDIGRRRLEPGHADV